MKFYHTTFSEYLLQQQRLNLHPELEYPQQHHQLTQKTTPPNTIFYGPSGVGKYSQSLKYILPYSPTKLQHYKKIKFIKDKFSLMYRISDIHYEIDMASLGCNAKTIWHEIFQQCVDIIAVQPHKSGIFLCKNFHAIHIDLLDIFYSYMQTSIDANPLTIKFVLLTEHISFLPTIILDNASIVPVKRPRRDLYAKIPRTLGNLPQHLHTIKNIKELYFVRNWENYTSKRLIQTVSTPILASLGLIETSKSNKQQDQFSYSQFRDLLYDILVYNLEVSDCLWYMLSIIKTKRTQAQISEILDKTFMFFKYYNNNYRPIFHLEYMFLSI